MSVSCGKAVRISSTSEGSQLGGVLQENIRDAGEGGGGGFTAGEQEEVDARFDLGDAHAFVVGVVAVAEHVCYEIIPLLWTTTTCCCCWPRCLQSLVDHLLGEVEVILTPLCCAPGQHAFQNALHAGEAQVSERSEPRKRFHMLVKHRGPGMSTRGSDAIKGLAKG